MNELRVLVVLCSNAFFFIILTIFLLRRMETQVITGSL